MHPKPHRQNSARHRNQNLRVCSAWPSWPLIIFPLPRLIEVNLSENVIFPVHISLLRLHCISIMVLLNFAKHTAAGWTQLNFRALAIIAVVGVAPMRCFRQIVRAIEGKIGLREIFYVQLVKLAGNGTAKKNRRRRPTKFSFPGGGGGSDLWFMLLLAFVRWKAGWAFHSTTRQNKGKPASWRGYWVVRRESSFSVRKRVKD